MLHSHGEIIELNPLVIEHHPVQAPKDAPADEFFSVWHEIHERIQYVPGLGKMGSGKISFKGVFHDMPWGLQTHTYAPAGVDIRIKYQIKGNQPGEARAPRELGDKAPADGLYLQEDVEIVCNFTMISFVRKNMQKATAIMIARLLKKAELLDAGQLQALFENGRLKTVNPAVQNQFGGPASPRLPSQMSALGPGVGGQLQQQQQQPPYSPHLMGSSLNNNQNGNDTMPSPRNSVRNSYYPQHQHLPENPSSQHNPSSAYARQSQQYAAPQNFAVEMPGSYHYPQQQQQQQQNPAYLHSQSHNNNNNNNRTSYMSELSGSSPRQSSFPTPQTDSSSPHLGGGGGGGQSPRVGGGGSVYGGSQYSDTTATSELAGGGAGGYYHSGKPMGSPAMPSQSDRDRYSTASEMPTSEMR